MRLRIGQGFDAHRLREGGRLVLGGVDIPSDYGLKAHSDGDCLLHALTDALLGAMGRGDIGWHFPDTDPAHANRDSREMLRSALALGKPDGWRVVNADTTIIAQQPRLSDYLPAMREVLASELGIDVAAANVKATTSERMGFTGRGEGIAAMAVVLISGE
jgi:2-C-methyl-D-erythritol 2,4-cyclodiphosphate synthase